MTVDETHSNQHSEVARSSHLSPREFAALGIAGLKSKNTVRHYIRAWESSGLERPVPGALHLARHIECVRARAAYCVRTAWRAVTRVRTLACRHWC